MKIGYKWTLPVLVLALVVILLFLPTRWAGGRANVVEVKPTDIKLVAPIPPPALPELASVNSYISRLTGKGIPGEMQGILLQTMDGKVLIDRNADVPMNPASVMKLATSYLSLKRFKPDYKFKTVAYTFGTIDESKQVLYGDIVIETEGDPNFTFEDAQQLAASIRSQGIKRVEGDLIINGPLRFRHFFSADFAYHKMRTILGLNFSNKNRDSKSPATSVSATPNSNQASSQNNERILLGLHYGQPLREMLLYMNAHSDNHYAEELGLALGGAEAVQAELMAEFHLKPETLIISHTSGLDVNRITPRTSIAVLHKMIKLLEEHGMRIEDIMPVAGVDSGTLINRLKNPLVSGSVIAKTGTLPITDNGVSTLEGVIYSEKQGPLLFAIFNNIGNINFFRQEQDHFLCDMVAELGITPQTVRTTDIIQPNPNVEDGAADEVTEPQSTRQKNQRSNTRGRNRR